MKTLNPSSYLKTLDSGLHGRLPFGEGNYQLYTADVISEEIQASKEVGVRRVSALERFFNIQLKLMTAKDFQNHWESFSSFYCCVNEL